VTDDELGAAVDDAQNKAHAAARKHFPPGMTGQTSIIVNAARLDCIEALLITIIARESNYVGNSKQKTLQEMRDYWEMVTKAIES